MPQRNWRFWAAVGGVGFVLLPGIFLSVAWLGENPANGDAERHSKPPIRQGNFRSLEASLSAANKSLARGDYQAAKQHAAAAINAAGGRPELVQQAKALLASAEQLAAQHARTRERITPGSDYQGRWTLGKHGGSLGLRFPGNPLDQTPGKPVQAELYSTDSAIPPLRLVGSIEFDRDQERFVVRLATDASQPSGAALSLRDELPKTVNFLTRGNDRAYELQEKQGRLLGTTSQKETIELLSVKADNFAAQLASLMDRPASSSPLAESRAIPALPKKLLAANQRDAELRLPDKAGEIMRLFARPNEPRNLHYCINEVRFRPQGDAIFSAQSWGYGRAWDLDADLARPLSQPRMTKGIALSDDGKMLGVLRLLGAEGTRACLVNAATGQDIGKLPTKASRLALSPHGDLAAIVPPYGSAVQVYRWDSGEPMFEKAHPAPITAVAFSRDGKHLLSASEGNEVAVAHLQDPGREVARYRGHQYPVRSIWTSRNGDFAMTAAYADKNTSSKDGSAKVELHGWNVATGDIEYRATINDIRFVALSPDWTRLLTNSSSNGAGLFDLTSGREFYQLRGHTRPVTAADFSRDSRYVATGGEDDFVILWGLPQPAPTDR